MGNKRNVSIDIAKGIGILLVIIGHGAIPSWCKDAIFSFHMPLFFILSGYFFRNETPLVRMRKDAKRLLLPYVVTIAVITLYMLIVHQVIKRDGWYYIINTLWLGIYPTGAPGGLNFSGPVWFLFALFWTKGTFNLIEKVHNRWFYLILAFTAFAPFYLSYLIGRDLPLAISQGLISIVFFWLRTPELAIQRVAERVKHGGHNIPEDTIKRRYVAGISNLFQLFMKEVDFWAVYDNSEQQRQKVASGKKGAKIDIFNIESLNKIKAYVR